MLIHPPRITTEPRLANNHAIAVNLRDGFPYPYTIEDAITVCYVNFQN